MAAEASVARGSHPVPSFSARNSTFQLAILSGRSAGSGDAGMICGVQPAARSSASGATIYLSIRRMCADRSSTSIVMRGVSAQASESDRPPRLVHRGDAMFPVVTDLAVPMIDRPRGELGARALEARALASAEAPGAGCTQRTADDMLENRPVARKGVV